MKWLFPKKCKVNQEKSKRDLPQPTWKQKCKTWDRKIVLGLGLLAIFTLMGIVISIICGSSYNPATKMYYNVEFEQKCTVNKCKVACSDIDEKVKSVAEYIIEALKKENCNSITELSITETKFKDLELNNGWLTNIEQEVKELTIQKCTLENINIRAFADHPFNNINYLTIVDAELKTLTRLSFLDLNTLARFAFRNNGSPKSLKIEERVLEGMKSNLEDLQISKYILSPDDIINLIGNEDVNLSKLVKLTLDYNSISELKDNSFISATNIISLYLHGNGLITIHQNTFRWLTSLVLLELSDNGLVTLPQDVFNGLEKLNKGGIELSNNKWKCNCSLQWLKEYYNTTNTINKEKPPICFPEYKTFDDLDFCPDLTSTASTPLSESVTSSSSSLETAKTTTELPSEFIRVKCRDQTFLSGDEKVDHIHRVEVDVEGKSIVLELHELEEEPLKVQISTKGVLTDYNLLWFNVDDKEVIGCRTTVKDKMLLDELKRNTTYSFSLIYGLDSKVSPKCTFCMRTEPEWKFRPWIENKYQVAFIALSVLIAVFLIGFTAFITFLCVRRYPKMIAGNKNVIILEPKKDSDEEIHPTEQESPAFWDPHLVSSSYGYHRHAKIRFRPPVIRSISEWSLTNTTNESNYQYVDPRHPQALKTPRIGRHNQNEIVAANVYDYRPPLPPPNAGSKSPSATTQEELYTSV